MKQQPNPPNKSVSSYIRQKFSVENTVFRHARQDEKWIMSMHMLHVCDTNFSPKKEHFSRILSKTQKFSTGPWESWQAVRSIWRWRTYHKGTWEWRPVRQQRCRPDTHRAAARCLNALQRIEVATMPKRIHESWAGRRLRKTGKHSWANQIQSKAFLNGAFPSLLVLPLCVSMPPFISSINQVLLCHFGSPLLLDKTIFITWVLFPTQSYSNPLMLLHSDYPSFNSQKSMILGFHFHRTANTHLITTL